MKLLPIWICITAYLGCFGINISAQTETVTISIQQELKETETPKPISWVVVPDGSGRSLLVLQGGQVLVVPADRKQSKISSFLKLSPESNDCERF